MSAAVECHILNTGYCLASEHLLLRGGRRQQIACHSLVALLRHPREGWLLWDTGYAPRMLELTAHWPASLYRRLTPLYIRAELAVVRQIAHFGLAPEDIHHILISHFHADHLCGLLDFPSARFVAARSAYEHVAGRQGFAALRWAFLPGLLPADFSARATLLDAPTGDSLAGLGSTQDLFGDGSLRLVALPGHARGQMGLLARTGRGEVLLAADSAWLSRSIYEQRPPGRLTNLIVDEPRAVRTTISHLHAFAQARPDVRIIPTHCPEAFAREVGGRADGR
jgi:glyoxylase-like metal-dependent hydrolase (beta-lactamase superfamily II)